MVGNISSTVERPFWLRVEEDEEWAWEGLPSWAAGADAGGGRGRGRGRGSYAPPGLHDDDDDDYGDDGDPDDAFWDRIWEGFGDEGDDDAA